MSRANPYAFDPNLMQGFSNLTRALIGSASDDAALARARASDATAALRNSQTAGVNQDNAMNKELYAMGNKLALEPAFQSQIAQALGLDTMASGFMGPPAPGQIRLGTDNANAMARTALGTYGNAEQMTGAFNNVGEGADSSLARSMILSGTDNQAGRGALMLSPGGGKYQNPGFAGLELSTNDATNRADDILDYNADVNEDNLRFGVGGQGDRDTTADNTQLDVNNQRDNNTQQREDDLRFGPGGQGDRDTTAQERWEMYKADKDKEAKVYEVDKDDTFARWKHDNRDIEISVEPGKQVVVNPAAGKLLGIQPNDNGLYVLDGGPKPGALVIKVGKEDVFLTEKDAEALGIKKNDDGQYVIPGKPELAPKGSSGGSGGGSDGGVGTGSVLNMTRYQTQWTKTYEELGSTDLPKHAIGGMKTLTSQLISATAQANPNMDVNQLYDAIAVPIIAAGAYEVTTGSNFFVPKYFVDYYANLSPDEFARENSVPANAKEGTMSAFRTTFMQRMNYNDNQVNRLLQEIQKMRSQ